MRKKFLFGEKKAVVTSVLAVLIICFASIAVPATNGSKILDIVDNKCKILTTRQNDDAISDFYETIQGQDDISYEDVFSYVKNNLVEDNNKIFLALISQMENIFSKHLDKDSFKISSSVFKQMQDFIGSPDMSKIELLQVVYSKIIPLYKEIQKITVGEKPIDQMSPDLNNLLEIFGKPLNANYAIYNNGHDKQITHLNDPNEDFDDYWFWYEKALDKWQESPIEKDNFEDWFNEVSSGNEEIFDNAMKDFRNIIIVTIVNRVAGLVLFTLFMNDVINYLVYIISSTNLFFELMVREVDIILHVVDDKGNGIDGLAIRDEEKIAAYSVNVIEEKQSEFHDDFTYTLGPITDVSQSGWYSLSQRWGPNYLLAPAPPGKWHITIDDGNGPWKTNETECSISSGQVYVIEMMLEPDE